MDAVKHPCSCIGSVREQSGMQDFWYRIRTNRELYELFNDMHIAKRINIQWLRWLGHVVWMDEDAPLRQVFDAVVVGHRRRGRPHMRWNDQVEEALTSLGVTN